LHGLCTIFGMIIQFLGCFVWYILVWLYYFLHELCWNIFVFIAWNVYSELSLIMLFRTWWYREIEAWLLGPSILHTSFKILDFNNFLMWKWNLRLFLKRIFLLHKPIFSQKVFLSKNLKNRPSVKEIFFCLQIAHTGYAKKGFLADLKNGN
jgi:hypothetical protein